MITFARAAFAASIVAAFAAVNGCAVSTGEEGQTSEQDLWKCQSNGDCTLDTKIKCDPATDCCYQGGEAITASGACGQKLAAAGCKGNATTTPGFAAAVETTGYGHWWFQVWCPPSASTLASDPTCQTAGVHWNFAGNNCSKPRPSTIPSTWANVEYDPNCGGNCSMISY